MNVNGDIVSVAGGASYAVYASPQSSTSAGTSGSGSSADTVDISAEGRAASLGTFSNRFQHYIDSGFLSIRNPSHVNVVRPGSAAAATYSVRGQAQSLVQGGGLAGVQGAIFALRYGDDAPNSATNGIAYRRAINEFRRISSQNLPLLSMVG